MQVLQVCAYGAEYAGNFIASLEALEEELSKKNIQTIYAFVERAASKEWCKKIQERTKVYFLPEAKARIHPKVYCIMRKIYKENDVGIVHTHFELYDIPATVCAPRVTKVFWHLHDPIQPQKDLRGLIWKIQYGIVGKKAKLISVSKAYRDIAVSLGFPKENTYMILNSIDFSRVGAIDSTQKKEYDFLTFGWDFYRKGDDLILNVCDRLFKEGYRFKLLLNGNEGTWPILQEYMNGRNAEYLTKGEPVKDIKGLFEKTKIFVQASRKETFSYAICEATYAGLPVISSDINGLEWAHELPSVSFFENENEEALYQLMKKRLDEPMIGQDALERSKQIIISKYSLQVWVNNILNQYNVGNE